MKKFYNRQQEMNQLLDMQRQAFEDYSRFVVLTGRRRVGKTSLVAKLMEEMWAWLRLIFDCGEAFYEKNFSAAGPERTAAFFVPAPAA